MKCDFLVIGGGIAGVSIAYELAGLGVSVILAERENHPGYHTTGRSAAAFLQSYGNPVVCALSRASKAFYDVPPDGFCDYPLLSPRGALMVSDFDPDNIQKIEQALLDDAAGGYLQRVEASEAQRMCPVLKEGSIALGVYEAGAMDIDVNALMSGYLTGFRQRGGDIMTDAEVEQLSRREGEWLVQTRSGTVHAKNIINASGAWADVVAQMAGTHTVGLTPLRRTALTFDPGFDVSKLMLTGDIDEKWYFRPEGGELMISPADETPSEPCDAQPEELDIAIIIDQIETVTTLKVKRISSTRAGLRSFVNDHSPVIGYAEDVEGFFWMAGQGGYGIQMAPALARLASTIAVNGTIPDQAAIAGVSQEDISPSRYA